MGAVGADEEGVRSCGAVGEGGCDAVCLRGCCWGEGGEGFGPLCCAQGFVSLSLHRSIFQRFESYRDVDRILIYLHIHPLQQQRPQPFPRDADPFAGRDLPLGLPALQVEEQEMAIFTRLAGFRIDVDFWKAIDQVLGQKGEKLG